MAFFLAHELGHVALGHLSREPAIVDLGDIVETSSQTDSEEVSADRFALEILTGFPEPKVLPKGGYNSKELARVALKVSPELAIDPGILALCFGHSTGDWATARAAVRKIYQKSQPVWVQINRLAHNQLSLDRLPEDSKEYVSAVLGGIENQ